MIIDFRYHVASLVAIFIALALGMLIGSTLVGQDFLENITNEQKLWIGKLEQDYLSLKKETEMIRAELKDKNNQLTEYHNFMTKITPYLVDGKLKDKSFAILEFDQNAPSSNVIEILERSGALIASNTRLSITSNLLRDYTINQLLENAVDLILLGEETEVTDFMEGRDIIKSIGNFGDPIDGLILVTGSSNDQNKFILETQKYITNYLKDKISLYVISNEDIPHNYVSAEEVCYLNRIDTISGQVNLVISILEKLNPNDTQVKKQNY